MKQCGAYHERSQSTRSRSSDSNTGLFHFTIAMFRRPSTSQCSKARPGGKQTLSNHHVQLQFLILRNYLPLFLQNVPTPCYQPYLAGVLHHLISNSRMFIVVFDKLTCRAAATPRRPNWSSHTSSNTGLYETAFGDTFVLPMSKSG
jgi:hypothetical protein